MLQWKSIGRLQQCVGNGMEISCNRSVPQRGKGTGILMLNMGGPKELSEVKPFLLRLFQDKDILQLPFQKSLGAWIAHRRTPSIQAKYAEIGGGSPILKWTNRQGELTCAELDRISPLTAPHKHYVGFRYAQPLTEFTLDQMEKYTPNRRSLNMVAANLYMNGKHETVYVQSPIVSDHSGKGIAESIYNSMESVFGEGKWQSRDGVKRAVAFSQYPQYSCATSGSSIHALHQFYTAKGKSGIKWSVLDRWGTNPHLVETIVERIKDQLSKFETKGPIVILFSAHSLPMKAVNRGDPYPTEVAATVQLVMQKLQFKYPYRLVWQSKVGPVPWLQPKTEEAIKGLSKKNLKNILLVPIAFINEHIETLHELDIEYGDELAKEVGVTVRRAECPNDHPIFIKGMAQMLADHLSAVENGKENAVSPQLLMTCPLCTRDTCRDTKKWLYSLNAK